MAIAVQVALVCVLVAISQMPVLGEVIDRIVATVNGVAILQSDVDQAIRYEALLQGRSLQDVTGAEQHSTLQRLIDQELLRQQMADTVPEPAAPEVLEQMRSIRKQVPKGNTDENWRAELQAYGLTESQLKERLAAQMRITTFVETRLRANVHVDAASVQAYYHNNLLPELRKRGVKAEPPLAEVSAQIEEVLRQQKMDEMLSSWLRDLRDQGRIRLGPQPEPAAPGQKTSQTAAGATSR